MKTKEIYGTLEWSQEQMSFHFSAPGDKRISGWEPVAEGIDSNVSAGFINFLNHNWKHRQPLRATEIGEFFTTWRLLKEEGGQNG